MEIAGTSDAVWLLMLDISECPSKDGDKPQDLSLMWLTTHEGLLFRELNGESLSESHDEEYHDNFFHNR